MQVRSSRRGRHMPPPSVFCATRELSPFGDIRRPGDAHRWIAGRGRHGNGTAANGTGRRPAVEGLTDPSSGVRGDLPSDGAAATTGATNASGVFVRLRARRNLQSSSQAGSRSLSEPGPGTRPFAERSAATRAARPPRLMADYRAVAVCGRQASEPCERVRSSSGRRRRRRSRERDRSRPASARETAACR